MPHEQPIRRVAIIGPGAIGLVLAVRLALAPDKPSVTLIEHRPDRAARLSAKPLKLLSAGGDLQAPVPVRLAPDAPPDLVLLAVKAYAAADAARAAAPWIGTAPLVAMQNGLGAAAEVAAVLPRTTVITATSYQAATLVAEGEVRHVANLVTYLGYEGRPPDEAVRLAADVLTAASIPAEAAEDMRGLVWGKLIINAAINPVAALAGEPNGRIVERPTLRALARAIAEEGEAVAQAEGIKLPYTSAVEAVLETARETSANRCSMLQDLDAGRPTEIDYLNGAIVGVAEKHGLSVPANRAIASLIRQVSHKKS
jgi:2-dehydropantoate 2-reductase